jgi:hypothetical protein
LQECAQAGRQVGRGLHEGLRLALGHDGAQGAQALAENRSGQAEGLEQTAAVHAAYTRCQLQAQPCA